jgi:hypothetical protein
VVGVLLVVDAPGHQVPNLQDVIAILLGVAAVAAAQPEILHVLAPKIRNDWNVYAHSGVS